MSPSLSGATLLTVLEGVPLSVSWDNDTELNVKVN